MVISLFTKAKTDKAKVPKRDNLAKFLFFIIDEWVEMLIYKYSLITDK